MKHIILISGKLQSGKNQFATYLKEAFELKGLKVEQDLFAKGVKDGCKEDFKRLSDYLNDLHNKLYKLVNVNYGIPEFLDILKLVDSLNISDENWYENKTDLTRILLQIYGTEIFRKRVDPDYWVKQIQERVIGSSTDVILITDVRFPNEIEDIKSLEKIYKCKVYAIRINRKQKEDEIISEHDSERSLDNYTAWDIIINNNKTLEDLRTHANFVASNDLSLFVSLMSGKENKHYENNS